MIKPGRMALLLPAGVALLAGTAGAVLLLGLPVPLATDRLPLVHGPLMVLGFIGCVIALERAVALARAWGFLAPGLIGSGTVLVVSPAPLTYGQVLVVAGLFAQLAVYAALWRRQGSPALALQVLGAVLAAGSAVLWWGGAPMSTLLPWFTGYVVLTIAGERIELARVGRLPARTERTLLQLGLALVAAVVGTALWPAVAHPVLGGVLLGVVGLLLVHDVARRTVRSTGLPRYVALCLLGGYVWLALAAAIWLALGAVTQGPGYDAVVHAVFLGFTLSMVMAHAPVILPAVLRVPLPYHPSFFAPVALLHGSLALRVGVGDLHAVPWALQVGGALNVASIGLFLVLAVSSSVAARPRRRAVGAVAPRTSIGVGA